MRPGVKNLIPLNIKEKVGQNNVSLRMDSSSQFSLNAISACGVQAPLLQQHRSQSRIRCPNLCFFINRARGWLANTGLKISFSGMLFRNRGSLRRSHQKAWAKGVRCPPVKSCWLSTEKMDKRLKSGTSRLVPE